MGANCFRFWYKMIVFVVFNSSGQTITIIEQWCDKLLSVIIEYFFFNLSFIVNESVRTRNTLHTAMIIEWSGMESNGMDYCVPPAQLTVLAIFGWFSHSVAIVLFTQGNFLQFNAFEWIETNESIFHWTPPLNL